MAQWGKNDQLSDVPKFAVDDKGNTGADEYGTTVFGVDAAEVAAGNAPHCGWVRRTEGTGGRAGRVHEEVLVALSSSAFASGDAADFAGAEASDDPLVGTADDTEYPDS